MKPGQAYASRKESHFDKSFPLGYIPSVEWVVEYTDEFEDWWKTLSEEEQVVIAAKVELLEKFGPTLPRPHSDVIATSKHSNMKELRGRTENSLLRVLYAFDPRRAAILLIGGDKKGNPRWYEEFVPVADVFSTNICLSYRGKERRKGVSMPNKFDMLRAKLSPGARERAHRLASKYEAEMALDELRVARDLTQEHLAQLLGVKQAAVSKMERRTDMYISTLQSIIRAMGGELKIQVVFPEGKVEISQFRKLKAAAGR